MTVDGTPIRIEANVELRFPLLSEKLRGALFVDVGQVWAQDQTIKPRDLVLTPGFGVRYFSAIGPVRVDVGYNPQSSQRLTVLTTRVCPRTSDPCRAQDIEPDRTYQRDQLDNTRELQSLGTIEWGRDRPFFDRLQLHFSIGQAF